MASKNWLKKTWPAREGSRDIGTFHASSPKAQGDLAGRLLTRILRDPLPGKQHAHNHVTPCCSCRSLNRQPQKIVIVIQVAALRKHEPTTIARIPVRGRQSRVWQR